MLTLATSGFGLVAALAWNSLIQDLVNNYVKKWFPTKGAVSVTSILRRSRNGLAVVVTLQLSKILQRLESDKYFLIVRGISPYQIRRVEIIADFFKQTFSGFFLI